MPDLTPLIESEAALPLRSESDGQSAQARSLKDLIEADKYLKGLAAVEGENATGGPRSAWGRVRMARAVPPGADPR